MLRDFAKGRYKTNGQVASKSPTRSREVKAAKAERDYDPGDPYVEMEVEQQPASVVALSAEHLAPSPPKRGPRQQQEHDGTLVSLFDKA